MEERVGKPLERKSLNKYFNPRETFQEKITASCSRNSHVSLSKEGFQILAHSLNREVHFSYSKQLSIQELIEDAFVISKTWTFKGDDIGVVSLTKYDPKTGLISVCLIFCDLIHETLIGVFPVRHNGKEYIQHADIFSCQLSRDSSVLGFVLGVMPANENMNEECQSQIYFFDVALWIMIRCFQSFKAIPPAISFDPRFRRSRVVIAGHQGNSEDELPVTGVFCLKSGRFLSTCHLDLFDVNGDSTIQLSHTVDGQHLIFQVIEWTGRGQEFLYRTYILDPDTFQLRMRCKSLLAVTCHDECFPHVFPVVSPDCHYMALVGKGQDTGKDFWVEHYTLPPPLNLKSLARRNILESLRDPVANIDQLHLSDALKQYLNYKQSSD